MGLKLRLRAIRLSFFLTILRDVPRIILVHLRGKLEGPISPQLDFGNNVDKGPQEVRVASGGEAIARELREAMGQGKPVNVGGSTHSVNGQTLSKGGVRLLLRPDPAARVEELADGLIDVPATLKWQDLEAMLRARGRTCAVLTDNLGTTVGGTLSVGGVGTRSITHGRQVDNVERLKLVLPSGERVWCSPVERSELFRHALAGLGLFGVIERAVLRTLELKPFSVVYKFQHETLVDAADSLAMLASGDGPPPELDQHEIVGPQLATRLIHSRFGFEYRTRDEAQAALGETPRFLEPLLPKLIRRWIEPTEKFMDQNGRQSDQFIPTLGRCHHLWNDWFFARPDDFRAFIEYLEQDLFRTCGKENLMSGLFFLLRRRPGRPHVPLSCAPTGASASFYGGLFYSVPVARPERAEQVRQGLLRAQQRAHELSGRFYLYAWQCFDEPTLARVYGDDWTSVVKLKRELDPRHLLNPDVLVPPA